MRKINTRDFRLATRRTQREVNQRIALNLIREFGPISRAELSRKMQLRRGSVTPLIRELLSRSLVSEASAPAVVRGRRPTLLSVRDGDRLIAAADVRPTTTFLALADASGKLIAREGIATPRQPRQLVERIAAGLDALVASSGRGASVKAACVGAGVVVPGMIDRTTGRLLYSPRLGWRDVNLREAIAERLGVRTFIEGAPIACALARLWLSPESTRQVQSFAYVHVSDGVGVGLILNGEPIRGDGHSAGEFGHLPLESDGPACICGRHGCWEAFANNSATVARYVGSRGGAARGMTIDEVVRRAHVGDEYATAALLATARYIGRGLSLVVGAFNPGLIVLGGEITRAWDLIEGPIRDALQHGGILERARRTPVVAGGVPGEQRILGAVALVNAPSFAALSVG